jgi:hypothetical protein
LTYTEALADEVTERYPSPAGSEDPSALAVGEATGVGSAALGAGIVLERVTEAAAADDTEAPRFDASDRIRVACQLGNSPGWARA